jgi:hypothetical protein
MKNFKNKIVIKSLSIYKFKKIFKFWFLLMFFLNFKESWVPSRSSKRTNSVSSRRKSNVGHYSDSNLTLYDPKFEKLCFTLVWVNPNTYDIDSPFYSEMTALTFVVNDRHDSAQIYWHSAPIQMSYWCLGILVKRCLVGTSHLEHDRHENHQLSMIFKTEPSEYLIGLKTHCSHFVWLINFKKLKYISS